MSRSDKSSQSVYLNLSIPYFCIKTSCPHLDKVSGDSGRTLRLLVDDILHGSEEVLDLSSVSAPISRNSGLADLVDGDAVSQDQLSFREACLYDNPRAIDQGYSSL